VASRLCRSRQGGLSDGLLLAFLLDGVPRGVGRARLLLNHCRSLPTWWGWVSGSDGVEVAEVGAKALDDDVCGCRSLLGGVLPSSPHVVLDVAGENLPLVGYLVGAD
jgi:hypothetical protein